MSELKDLEHRAKNSGPAELVSDAQMYRQWIERIRGRVGSAFRVPWYIARQKFTVDQMRGFYDAGESAADVAARIIGAWMRDQQFEAPLC